MSRSSNFVAEINVQQDVVRVRRVGEIDYISLTDLASHVNADDPSGVIRNWMSNKNSFDFYGLWEELNNDNFNSVEFHRIKTEEAPYNRFTMTPRRWRKEFGAIGIIPGAGKYSGGTYAHPDIAFEFASWLSPEFKLYLIKEFERLKASEAYQQEIEWQSNRLLAKTNYVIHTDAVKSYIVPLVSNRQRGHVYANEADVLNVALFGLTAKEWREQNPDKAKNGNIRDSADMMQLVVLSNLESMNAEMIRAGLAQGDRLVRLNDMARRQMDTLRNNIRVSKLLDNKQRGLPKGENEK